MTEVYSKHVLELMVYMDMLEKEKHNLPMIFTEILKDEINANDELNIYHGIKKFIQKHSENRNSIYIINEFFKILSGGVSLDEIMQISLDETRNPHTASKETYSNLINDIFGLSYLQKDLVTS